MGKAYHKILDGTNAAWLWFDKLFDTIFPQRLNPNYYLGGITNLFLWVCMISGLVLMAAYKPTLAGAWSSVDFLNKIPYGVVMRGIHRYGADAMWIALILHMMRTWFTRRERKFRYVAWMSGVILLVMTLTTGVTGYLLVWDDRASAIARLTENMLHSVPLLGSWFLALFRGGDVVTDLTLTRFFFYHITIPFLLIFFLWMHYLRVNRPIVYPPAALSMLLVGIVIFAAGAGGFYPALGITSGPSATATIPAVFNVDWMYMWGYWPIQHGLAAGAVMALFVALIAFLFYVPYAGKEEYTNVAQVINENCTGCGLCAEDCHANAIVMVPAVNAPRRGQKNLLAMVIAPRCAECGICVGACPFEALEMPLLLEKQVEDVIAKGLVEA
jgi:quinol-cytochrome oxidoreductase complex cytochrome b subunit